MSNLSYRQEKIQVKRKATPWRDFVMEIASRMPVIFYKIDNNVSRFPDTSRLGGIISVKDYPQHNNIEGNYLGNFFNSYEDLFLGSPKMIVQQWFENENSNYAECYGAKNCYLSFGVGQKAENILYTLMSHTNINNIFNSFVVVGNCDNVYYSRCITTSYNIFFSSNIHNSSNIWFSSNMLGCNECIGCNNLENQSYYINNKQYNKEDYKKIKSKILSDKGSYCIHKDTVYSLSLDNKLSEHVNGNGIVNSKNIENGFFVQNLINGRNIFLGGGQYGGSYFYDCFDAGNQEDTHLYATNYVGENSSHVYCVVGGAHISNCYYSYHLESCSFCLGCIGLKNKSYCILNKQYTKEERYTKVDEIFTQMEQDGQLGEFFPASMNPFYFNDTAAYLIDNSFTKEEVMAKGYLWRDEPIKVDIPEGAKVVKTTELDQYEGREDASSGTIVKDLTILSGDVSTSAFTTGDLAAGCIRWIDPEILKVIIQDDQGNVYKIVKMEYDFLMKYGLPLPRKHRLDRMKENFKIQ